MDMIYPHAWPWHRLGSIITLFFVGAIVALGGCANGGDANEASSAEDAPAGDLAALNSAYAATPHQTAYADVHRVDLPAGEGIPAHEGGPRVIYSLNAYTLQLQTDDSTAERSFERGAVHYHPEGVHAVDNAGETLASYMVFERTDGPLPATATDDETLDALSVSDGATHEVPLTNDRVTVHRIRLEPGASLPSHFGYPRIIYALTDYTLTFIDPASDARTERSFAEGDLHDHEAGMHAVENTGDRPAEYLVVAFKQ